MDAILALRAGSSAVRGELVWIKWCGSCHSDDSDALGPKLGSTLRGMWLKNPDEAWRYVVESVVAPSLVDRTDGRYYMPRMRGLEAQDIADVATFIVTGL